MTQPSLAERLTERPMALSTSIRPLLMNKASQAHTSEGQASHASDEGHGRLTTYGSEVVVSRCCPHA